MDSPFPTPWHKESYDRFLSVGLPEMLATRLLLGSYSVVETGASTCRLELSLSADAASRVIYESLPRPDEDGIFTIPALADSPEGARRVVVPTASSEDLESAEISCVGELLLADVGERLTQLPDDLMPLLQRDEGGVSRGLARWLPLGEWIHGFFTRARQAQMPDPTNYLAGRTHLRRLAILGDVTGFHPSHIGRVCFVETPEGPNCGRIASIARGARITGRRLVVVDETPAAGLGPGASLIPFLAHSEPARLLMGANMMRQWHPLPGAEPPLVQTGMEPDPAPDGLWCGVNLLTAFVFWGADTHEDALVLSESGAKRLGYPYPLEAGDKLSNRHGTKGVVSRIFPDDEMPHLADGTPTEIAYTFFGLPSRMNHGQLLEAALGRVARTERKPAVAPPFGGPSPEELKARLESAGLPGSGMERLTAGKGGAPLSRESTVGYVYWGRTAHDARDKVQALADAPAEDRSRGQRIGGNEYRLLRQAGAVETLASLVVTQSEPPASARFAELQRGLNALGVSASVSEGRLSFAFTDAASGDGDAALRLAEAVPHPWFRERALTTVGAQPERPEYGALEEANRRLERMRQSGAPASLYESSRAALRRRVRAFADALLAPDALAPEVRVRLSGRAVIAPGSDLTVDEAGLPEEMAWALFGPLLVREGTADAGAVAARTEAAVQALEARMARAWVLLNRQPSLYDTSITAFRPLLRAGSVVRLHPLVCNWFDADFDGDQMAVFLPLGEAAQEESGRLLSVRGHMRRDPTLLTRPWGGLIEGHAFLYGLAERCRTDDGRKGVAALLGREVRPSAGYLVRADVVAPLEAVLKEQGVDAVLDTLERLWRYAFDAAKASGASIGPFAGHDLTLPAPPEDDDPAAWDAWGDEVVARLDGRAAACGFDGDDLGADLLAAASGARGRTAFLAKLIASVAPGSQAGMDGRPTPMRHGWRDGLTPPEMFIVAANTRRMLREMISRQTAEEADQPFLPTGGGVLARALRSRRPGIPLALAAATGETDPLVDFDSRLFVGLTSAAD
jgi:hypothetical protein